MSLLSGLKSKVIPDEAMSRHTTFRIGGRAAYWIEAYNLEELIAITKELKRKNIDYYLVGAGSNLLITDEPIKLAFIRLNSDHFRTFEIKDDIIEAGAGLMLQEMVKRAADKGLSGLEYLAGIPATLGGAIYQNAGSFSYNVSDFLDKVYVLNKDFNKVSLNKDDIDFSYRQSSLDDCIIISASFILHKATSDEVQRRLRKYLNEKALRQPLNEASAGSIFKNPAGGDLTSAQLIEQAGLKGRRLGGAEISTKHANYIINRHQASFNDVAGLITLIKQEVFDKFKVSLELEVKVIK